MTDIAPPAKPAVSNPRTAPAPAANFAYLCEQVGTVLAQQSTRTACVPMALVCHLLRYHLHWPPTDIAEALNLTTDEATKHLHSIDGLR